MSDNLVLIIGGSRSTGLHAAHILQRLRIPVRVLARDPVSALKRLGSGFDIMRGDLTDRASLLSALDGVSQLILTAGVRSGRFARPSVVRATEYHGILNTIDAACAHRFAGRLVYMTSIGVRRRSLFAFALNLWKGNTLRWRHQAEDAIRASGIDYTIVRAAFLLNRPPGEREISVRQVESPRHFMRRSPAPTSPKLWSRLCTTHGHHAPRLRSSGRGGREPPCGKTCSVVSSQTCVSAAVDVVRCLRAAHRTLLLRGCFGRAVEQMI